MAKIQSHRDLIVWQKAMDLAVEVYRLSEAFPKAEIYRLMRNLADSGVFILMISSDMEEVLGVSDRIAVMREGALMGILEAQDFSEEAVMRLAVARVQAKENSPTSNHPIPKEIRA